MHQCVRPCGREGGLLSGTGGSVDIRQYITSRISEYYRGGRQKKSVIKRLGEDVPFSKIEVHDCFGMNISLFHNSTETRGKLGL
jgi:hypothetical protein